MAKKDYNTKQEITKLIKDVLAKETKKSDFYKSKEFDKQVRNITKKSLEKLYKSFWTKRNVWQSDL